MNLRPNESVSEESNDGTRGVPLARDISIDDDGGSVENERLRKSSIEPDPCDLSLH
jgi:hypothetical protein